MTRKKGAQPGNLNALKHGFYSKCLSPAEIRALRDAGSIEGLDVEIALIRFKIRQLLERDPYNLQLMLRASSMLARLHRAKCQTNPPQHDGLQQAIENVFRVIGLPLGVKVAREL